jgi:hypothetical protein
VHDAAKATTTATRPTAQTTRERPQPRTSETAAPGPYGGVERLQRLAGNRAVAGWFAASRVSSPVSSPVSNEAQPLDPSLRASMESRFHSDLSGVRIHAGDQAAALARSHHARAYAQGQNIVFGDGQFAPDEPDGRRLLTHELAHVVQQSGPSGSQPGAAHEREAESAASLAPGSAGIRVSMASAPGAIQCSPDTEEDVREDVEKEKRKFEETKKQHQDRLDKLGPPPVGELPLDVFKKAGVTTTSPVTVKTAGLIDSVLERSAVLRPYIKEKLSGKHKIRIPGAKFIHHTKDTEFEKAINAGHVPVAGSQEEKELKKIKGFYNTKSDEIHLRPDSNVGDALHESIHKFASPNTFLFNFGKYLTEGVTQYFTDLVLQEQGLPKGKSAYADNLDCANKLVALSSSDIVARAYFRQDLGPLADAVARKLNISVNEVLKRGKDDTLCNSL